MLFQFHRLSAGNALRVHNTCARTSLACPVADMTTHSAFASAFLLFVAVALPVAAADAPAVSRTAEEQGVLAAVDATLAAVSARDEPGTRRQLRPTGTATVLLHQADGSVRVRNAALGAYAEATPGPERYLERMHDPLVRVQGDMALVWGRYSFAVDGKVAHCGYQHFDLVREAGQWKVQNVTWSVQRSGCDSGAAEPE
jgi:hypothetical protein